jgi:1-acyl-sn-glycerol-3-phosphate acyltransferase
MLIYPEGATTNNTTIIHFKRGAFMSNTPVQPFCMKYYSPYFDVNQAVVGPFQGMIHLFAQPYITCKVKILPTFHPNEYFFKHHQQEGEQEW